MLVSFRGRKGMKLKTLLALLVLAHALVHPLAHALPVLTGAAEQAQSPAPRSGTQVRSTAPCPACLSHRLILADAVLISTVAPNWQPVLLAPPSRVSSFLSLSRPARAPPLA